VPEEGLPVQVVQGLLELVLLEREQAQLPQPEELPQPALELELEP
jgi:hypothetical protein